MKKTAIVLVVALLAALFCIPSSANNIPVSAEVSETVDGDLRIVVYVQNVEKLVSLTTVVEYDTTAYNLKQAKASAYTDSAGDEAENLVGLWALGNLADGSGCVGAFISFDGVTKIAKTAACEFIIEALDGEAHKSDITVSVKELVTEDGDEENDIRKKTPILLEAPMVDVSGMFEYEIPGGKANITEIKLTDNVVFIPDSILGVPVRSLDTETEVENPFIVFGRNVLSIGNRTLTSGSTVIAPMNSAPTAAAKIAGGKYLGYYENVTADLTENILYTDSYVIDKGDRIFSATAEVKVLPSHNIMTEYWGTGTVITLKNSDNSADFLLCVKGDINGDSVCDVLDIVSSEKHINDEYVLTGIEEKSADFDGDNDITVQDFTRIVNIAMGSEYKIFEGIRGDFNGDYTVDILDIYIFNKTFNNKSMTEKEKALYDLNNDGVVDNSDRTVLFDLIELFE